MKRYLKHIGSLVLAGVLIAAVVVYGQIPASFVRSGMVLGQSPVGVGPGASAYNSTTQSLPGSFASVPLTFNVNSFDTGSIHSTSVNPTRFIAPSSGYYLAVCNVGTVGSVGLSGLEITKNGASATPLIAYAPGVSSTAAVNQGLSIVMQLAAADYVECVLTTQNATTTSANSSTGQLIKLSTLL